MGQAWDQGRNQKVSGNKLKWTHNNPKLMGHSKAVLRGKFIPIQAYPKDRNISNKQPNCTPEQLEENNEDNPEQVEGRK